MTAAAQIFAQKGYAGTTTKDIAEAADLGESTLYNYFNNKRDIFIAIASQKAKAIDDLLGAAKPKDPPEMIALVDKALEIILSQAQYTRSLLIEAWMDNDLFENFLRVRLERVQQFIQDIIEEDISAGKLRRINPALGARMLIAMSIGAILPALRGTEASPSPEQRGAIAETIITVLLEGLKAP
jgi:AcrR family transcriptional regulator